WGVRDRRRPRKPAPARGLFRSALVTLLQTLTLRSLRAGSQATGQVQDERMRASAGGDVSRLSHRSRGVPGISVGKQALRAAERGLGLADQIGKDLGGGLYLADQSGALAGGHKGAVRVGILASKARKAHDAVALGDLRLDWEGLDLRRVALPFERILGANHAAWLSGVASRAHRGVVARLHDRFAVGARGLRLGSGDEAGSDYDALRAEGQCGGNLAAVCDAAGGEHGELYGAEHLRDQRDHPDFAGMAARFGSLGDDHIGARVLSLFAVMDLAAHHRDLHPVFVHGLDEFAGNGEAGDEDADLFLDQD